MVMAWLGPKVSYVFYVTHAERSPRRELSCCPKNIPSQPSVLPSVRLSVCPSVTRGKMPWGVLISTNVQRHTMTECVMKWKDHVKGINVAAQLNEQSTFRANPKSCHALVQILSTVKFLYRQGLPIRGHQHSTGNLQELLCLRCEDDRAEVVAAA